MNRIKSVLKSEFINGQTKFDWIFLVVGILMQIAAVVYGYFSGTPDSAISIISALTGIVSVVLCAQGKISFYIFGYIQLLTYVFGIAIPLHLWGEVFENIFYFVTMIVGTVIWFKNYKKTDEDAIKIEPKKMGAKGWVISLVSLGISTVILAFILMHIHEWIPSLEADPTPWFDSITTTAPFIAQIFLMLGYRDQWAFWVIEDVLSLIMFAILGNWVMVAMYLFWTINCGYGWYKWSKE